MTSPTARHRVAFILGPALISGFALWTRIWGIWAEPMWLDEAYSAYAASKGWHFLWTIVPRYETHPPLYYSLLRLWTLVAGEGLVAERLLGVLCGLATVPVTALAAQRLARIAGLEEAKVRNVALATGLLAAVSPVLIWISREVRPYAPMILAYAAATLALLAIAERRAAGLPLAGRAFGLWLIAGLLMLWLHNLGLLYAAAMLLALLCVVRVRTMRRDDWLWFAGGHLAVLLLWLPGLLILLDQAPEWVRATWLRFPSDDLLHRATYMFTGPGDDVRIAAAILAVCGGALLWRLRQRALLAALLLMALLPLILSLLISAMVAPVFIIRTMTPLAAPALPLIGLGTAWGWRQRGWLIPAIAFTWLAATQASFGIEKRERPRRDWYRAVEWLASRFRPGDIVLAYPNEGALPFDRAVRDLGLAMPSRPIPTAVPSLDPPPGSWYVSGSRGVPSLDRAHLHMIAQAPSTRAAPTIWLLRLGPWAYDKGDVFLDELSKDRTMVTWFNEGPINIVGLRRRDMVTNRSQRHVWTREEAKRISDCYAHNPGRGDAACFAFSASEKIAGIWIPEFEGSMFFETTVEQPRYVELSENTPWLEIAPSAKLHVLPNTTIQKAYYVEFVGRRSTEPGMFGHMGMSENEVLVDRMLKIKLVHPPAIRTSDQDR
jgi:hypothetical protein